MAMPQQRTVVVDGEEVEPPLEADSISLVVDLNEEFGFHKRSMDLGEETGEFALRGAHVGRPPLADHGYFGPDMPDVSRELRKARRR